MIRRRMVTTIATGLMLAGAVLTVQGFAPPEHPEQPQQPYMPPSSPTPTPEGPVESI